MALSSLIVCIARDPGPVTLDPPRASGGDDGEVNLNEALMAPEDDFSLPGRWCRKCWVRLNIFHSTEVCCNVRY